MRSMIVASLVGALVCSLAFGGVSELGEPQVVTAVQVDLGKLSENAAPAPTLVQGLLAAGEIVAEPVGHPNSSMVRCLTEAGAVQLLAAAYTAVEVRSSTRALLGGAQCIRPVLPPEGLEETRMERKAVQGLLDTSRVVCLLETQAIPGRRSHLAPLQLQPAALPIENDF